MNGGYLFYLKKKIHTKKPSLLKYLINVKNPTQACFQDNPHQNILDVTNVPDTLFKKASKSVTKEFLFSNPFPNAHSPEKQCLKLPKPGNHH